MMLAAHLRIALPWEPWNQADSGSQRPWTPRPGERRAGYGDALAVAAAAFAVAAVLAAAFLGRGVPHGVQARTPGATRTVGRTTKETCDQGRCYLVSAVLPSVERPGLPWIGR